MTRIAVHGASGRMGRQVIAAVAEDPKAQLVAALVRAGSPALGQDAGVFAGLGRELQVPITADMQAGLATADVLIDFSLPSGMLSVLAACAEAGVPAVVGTTGFGEAGQAALDRLATVAPVVFAPNFSVGVNVFWALARRAVQYLGADTDVEIVEMHHRHKVDAPSGTARRLLEVVADARGQAEVVDKVARHGRQGQVGARTAEEIGVHALRGGDVVGEHTLIMAPAGERIELTHRAHGREIFARGAVRASHWVTGQVCGRYGMEDVLGLAD